MKKSVIGHMIGTVVVCAAGAITGLAMMISAGKRIKR